MKGSDRHRDEVSPLYDVTHTVQVSSDVVHQCVICLRPDAFGQDVASRVNHYIQAHGYKLLHVGQQSGDDFQGHRVHQTVAILGRIDPKEK